MRELYVWRNGQMVRVDNDYKSPDRPPAERIHVINDEMPALFNPADGRLYTSKAKFRAAARAKGLTEVGNEEMKDTRRDVADYTAKKRKEALIEAINNGYYNRK